MRFSGSIRSAIRWVLLGTLLAGASVPHTHPIIAGGDEGGPASSSSARVITDDASSTLRWHSVIRVEQDDCVACHAHRTAGVSRPVVLRDSAPITVALTVPDDVRGLLRTLSPNSSRAPPSLL